MNREHEDGDSTERLDAGAREGQGEETFFVHVEPIESDDAGTARRVDWFTVLRRHAQGGLGRISLARDEHLQREVALKEIRPDLAAGADLEPRFINEARITGGLEHPGIVPIYALGHGDGGRPYYAMRFVQGETLNDSIADYHAAPTPLKFNEILRRFTGVCETMAYAHDRGVIHRDLKPENVMVGAFGETLVVDWGLAKRLGDAENPAPRGEGEDSAALTMDGHVIGTPAFMSPEQASGRIGDVGPASDIYALGAILFTILSNRSPYEGSGLDIVARLREGTPPTDLDELAPDASPALRAICGKAMAPDVATRYDSAQALARELQRFAADEPVEAYPEPWSTRAARWVRRHRTIVSSSVIALVILALSLSVAALLLDRARDREVTQRQRAEESYAMARLAVDEFVEIRQDPRLRSGELEDLRRRMASAEAGFFERFSRLRGDTPSFRLERARSLRLLAMATRDLTSAADALPHLREADALLRKLVSELPTARAERALVLHQIGEVCRIIGDHEEASAAITSAVDVAFELASEKPGDGVAVDRLAGMRQTLGTYHYHRGEYDEAMAAYGEALENALRAAELDPDLAMRRVIDLETSIGAIHFQRGKLEEATPHFERACRAYSDLAARHPGRHDLDRARALANLGSVYQSGGRTPDAEDALYEALELFEDLVERRPRVAEYRHNLARTIRNIGLCQRDLRDFEDARESFERAVSIHRALAREHPEDIEFGSGLVRALSSLGGVLARQGQNETALTTLQEARDRQHDLVRREPDVVGLKVLLGQCLIEVADRLIALDREPEAAAADEQALDAVEPALRQSPTHNARWIFERASLRLAERHRARGKIDDARRVLDRGIALIGEVAGASLMKLRAELED